MSELSIVTSAKACMWLTAKEILLVKINIIKLGNAYITVIYKITPNSVDHMVMNFQTFKKSIKNDLRYE